MAATVGSAANPSHWLRSIVASPSDAADAAHSSTRRLLRVPVCATKLLYVFLGPFLYKSPPPLILTFQ